MYKVSDAFAAAMANQPYIAKITLDGMDVIQGDPRDPDDPINEIVFRGGTNGDENGFTLGGAVSSSVEIIMNKDKVRYALSGREIKVELGMVLEDTTEWLPMGIYYVAEPLVDDDRLMVTAYDALGSKFETGYEDISGLSFDTEDGVSSKALLLALCARRGVPVDVSNLTDIPLKASPAGFTERQIIGFIAALYGGFADVDRTGVLRICSYIQSDAKVTADNYYEGGMEKADYVFSVQWLKCYNESADLTMIMGDTTAKQGIYLESIWMSNDILANLWEKIQNFSYTPVTELSFLGNPLIDAGDIIALEDLTAVSIKVPVMKITHEYDGGLITRITANGQAEADSYGGYVARQLQRSSAKAKTYSGISLDEAKKYTDALNETLNQLEVLKRLTADGVSDAIYMDEDTGKLAVKATAILTGVLDAAVVTVKNLIASNIVSGILKSKDGNTYFDLDNGKVVCKNEYRSVELSEGTIAIKNKAGIMTLFIVDTGIGGMLSFSDGNGNDVGSLFGDPTGLQLSLPDDSGGFTPHVLKWKQINGVNYLVGE